MIAVQITNPSECFKATEHRSSRPASRISHDDLTSRGIALMAVLFVDDCHVLIEANNIVTEKRGEIGQKDGFVFVDNTS